MWEPPEYPGPCFDLHFDRFDGFFKPVRNAAKQQASNQNGLHVSHGRSTSFPEEFELSEDSEEIEMEYFGRVLRVQKRKRELKERVFRKRVFRNSGLEMKKKKWNKIRNKTLCISGMMCKIRKSMFG